MTRNSSSHTIITAQPGWYVAMYVRGLKGADGWDEHLSLRPIIAWDIEREDVDAKDTSRVWHNVTPLTVDGNMNHYAEWWAIKTPDGKYSTPDGMCDNEPDAMDALKQVYEQDLKERAAASAQRSARCRGPVGVDLDQPAPDLSGDGIDTALRPCPEM